jgi:hypothetical protein
MAHTDNAVHACGHCVLPICVMCAWRMWCGHDGLRMTSL